MIGLAVYLGLHEMLAVIQRGHQMKSGPKASEKVTKNTEDI